MADGNAIRAGEAAVEITGDDKKLKAATDRAKKHIKGVVDEAKRAADAASVPGEDKGLLGSAALWAKRANKERRASGENALKKMLKNPAGLTQGAADMLGIGAGVMVLDMLGKGLASATAKAVELKQQMAEGKANAADMTLEIMKGLPVIGGFAEAGANLNKLFNVDKHLFGFKESVDEINKEAERTLAISNAQVAVAKRWKIAVNEVHDALQKTNLSLAAVGRGAYAQQWASLASRQVDLSSKRRQNNAHGDKAEALRKEYEPLLKGLAEERDAAAKQWTAGDASARAVMDNAQQRLRAKQAERDARIAQTIAETGELLNAEGQVIAAEGQELSRQYAQDWARAQQDAASELLSHQAGLRAQRLREVGQEQQAEQVLLEDALRQRTMALDRAAVDEAKRFGTIDAHDPRRQEIMDRAAAAKGAAYSEYVGKVGHLNRQLWEQERREALTLEELKIEGIDHVQARELASLDAKYRAEIELAQGNIQKQQSLWLQWGQARANLAKHQAQSVADAQHEMDVETEKARLLTQKQGIAQRLAELQIERREALRKEADPRTATGVGKRRINDLYDLKEQMELSHGRLAAGSFSAKELGRMSGSTPLGAIAKHTKDTADNTRKMANSRLAFSAN